MALFPGACSEKDYQSAPSAQASGHDRGTMRAFAKTRRRPAEKRGPSDIP